MTYEEAKRYLAAIPPFVPKKLASGEEPFNLDLIRELLLRLGNPERGLRYVHVTGTNGKGSTCAYLAQILTCAGYRTGLYTSPAIRRINERIRIDTEMVPDDVFAEAVSEVRGASESMAEDGFALPSEFEQVTAAAFLIFRDARCDVVVLEVGLGGRLDATNVIPAPELAVFLPISYEHTEVLGDSLEKIAREKAGIIKPGCTVLSAPQEKEAEIVLREAAERAGSSYVTAELPENAELANMRQRFSLGGAWYETTLLGPYQIENAAVAIAAAGLLTEKGIPLTEEAVRRGVLETRWPGRFELVRRNPDVIVDGSHNPAGVRALCEGLMSVYSNRKFVFLIGVLRDKPYEEMLREIVPLARRCFAVAPDSPRALPAEELADCLRSIGCEASVCGSVEEGARAALSSAEDGDVVCAFGSLYYIGEAREYFLGSDDACKRILK